MGKDNIQQQNLFLKFLQSATLTPFFHSALLWSCPLLHEALSYPS